MAVTVVDELEVVDVDKEGCNLLVLASVKLCLELTLKGVSVVEL